MHHFNDTIRALSLITDAGLFEHLATAVLRDARPELYSNLTQPGTNADGRPVMSPVDAISFVPGAVPRHMVAVHHTTCQQADLRKKWLHDPLTVKPRRQGKPTSLAGDLLKTAAIANEERAKTPDLHVTLALTTNKEPLQNVVREVERAASSYGITLDLWSCSRIANYLDNTPNGQWLRRKYLGMGQERLSIDLLRELSHKSLEANQPRVRRSEQIVRSGVQTLIASLAKPVGFLIGESGFGKSVACFQFLAQHIKQGGCGLILPHEVLESSIILDHAIDVALRQLHPSLAQGAGAEAQALCSESMPLLMVVEDINRSGQSAYLIERLAKWAANFKNKDQPEISPSWRLICPIWPELFGALSDDTRKHLEQMTERLGAFSPEEARNAVLTRAKLAKIEMSSLEADALSETLGYDPLLIGLHTLDGGTPPEKVIATFVAGSAERVARNGSFAACDYTISLRALAEEMLRSRQVDPTWSDVLAWFAGSQDHLRLLRELIKHGEVIRVANTAHNAKLCFRHDRVRKWLLTHAVTHALQRQSLDDTVFSEPFFADVIGIALADPTVPPSVAERARLSNPLALFYALHSFRESFTVGHNAVLSAIDVWLSDEMSHSRAHQSLRYAMLGILAETQSSHVCKLLLRFHDRSWSGALAGLRNGDLDSGIRLCFSVEPGISDIWRDRAIEHAKKHFGSVLIGELTAFLKQPEPTRTGIVGGLRLAGHLAEASLADAIKVCWNSDAERKEHLDDYLWAAAQCGGEQTETLLLPVCDAWAALPNEAEQQGMPSPRESLASHHIAWAFRKTLPQPALKYFICRAANDDLQWPIIYMLHGVDHPDAVAFIAKFLANRAREREENGGFSTFTTMLHGDWQRWQRERNKPMSQGSRACLQDLWINQNNDKHLRKQSFRLWAATSHPDDLSHLRSCSSPDILTDEVLGARLKRGDQTAIPAFIERIRTRGMRKSYWWQFGRDIWSDALTSLLDAELSHHGVLASPTGRDHDDTDWILSELLMRLDIATSELLLCKHWDHLRFSPYYVQTALHVATPRLLEMVNTAVTNCPTPANMFKHISSHFGIRFSNHPGVTRVEQVEGLIPYLDYIDEFSIYRFWELCNERGWMRLRREHLDARLGKWTNKAGLDDATLIAELDQELTRETPYYLYFWVDRHLENGRSIDSILSIVRQWLRSNRTTKALQVVASIVMHAGTRADVDLLNEGSDQSGLAEEIIADCCFAVRRRTLS